MVLSLLFTALAFAKSDLDVSRCNGIAGHAGVGLMSPGNDTPFFRLDTNGNLNFDSSHPRTLLRSSSKGKNLDELSYYEFMDRQSSRLGEGLGDTGVLSSQVKLLKEKARPVRLETTDTFFSLGETDWNKLKRSLKNGTLTLKKNERSRYTESWVVYGFSAERCYISQEGQLIAKRKVISFDQALCNQILQITDREDVDILHDFRAGDIRAKNEANRQLRLIRDAQVARDEALKREGQRLLAVEGLGDHQLPGTLPPEDSSALLELRGCIAAQVRNGLRRPEAHNRDSSDFMGNEPEPNLDEPSAAGTTK